MTQVYLLPSLTWRFGAPTRGKKAGKWFGSFHSAYDLDLYGNTLQEQNGGNYEQNYATWLETTGSFKLEDVTPLTTQPPYSLVHLGPSRRFWNSNYEPKYGDTSFLPLEGFFANSLAQEWKFGNRLDGPKLTLMVDIHAKFQVLSFLVLSFLVKAVGGRGVTSSNLKTSVH